MVKTSNTFNCARFLVFCLVFITCAVPASAQMNAFYYYIPGGTGGHWKWNFEQLWNTVSESWGDTLSIAYFSGGTAAQPAELITKREVMMARG